MKLASLKTKKKKNENTSKTNWYDPVATQKRREKAKRHGEEQIFNSGTSLPLITGWRLKQECLRAITKTKFLQKSSIAFFIPSCLTQGHGKITWAILCHLPHIFPFEGRVKQRQTKVEYNVLLLHLYIMYVMCIWGDTI